jgi:hypothetical protein
VGSRTRCSRKDPAARCARPVGQAQLWKERDGEDWNMRRWGEDTQHREEREFSPTHPHSDLVEPDAKSHERTLPNPAPSDRTGRPAPFPVFICVSASLPMCWSTLPIRRSGRAAGGWNNVLVAEVHQTHPARTGGYHRNTGDNAGGSQSSSILDLNSPSRRPRRVNA